MQYECTSIEEKTLYRVGISHITACLAVESVYVSAEVCMGGSHMSDSASQGLVWHHYISGTEEFIEFPCTACLCFLIFLITSYF